jgi:type I restriction enzyme, S subunit
MSRYKVYSDYRDSGVEWLGSIPSHWGISPLKYLARFSGGGTPSKDNPDFWNGDIPWVSPKDMKVRRVVATIDNVTDLAIKQSSTNLLEKGALLMVVRSGILQHSIPVAINNVPVSLNQDMKALRFVDPLLSEYAYYFVTGNQSSLLLEWSKEGATVESIEHEYLANTLFPCPPLKDRTTIISFLDHETAKIDALIEKQQRLIELLKEKRQAVISHAVTKGLNPNAPMKDSGVEWLGEVPAHWVVKKFSHCTIIKSGQVDPSKLPYSGFTLIAPNHIESGTGKIIGLETAETQGADSGKYLCSEGEVIYSKIRPNLAKVCLSPSDETICSADMYPISGINGLSNKFLYWSLLSNWFTSFVTLESDRVAMPKINREKLAEIFLPIPPENEQAELVVWLKNKTDIVDALLEKAKLGIELLQERRTALISAAVTGKIDVREWQAAA